MEKHVAALWEIIINSLLRNKEITEFDAFVLKTESGVVYFELINSFYHRSDLTGIQRFHVGIEVP